VRNHPYMRGIVAGIGHREVTVRGSQL
jgi:hypothetical protein